MSRPNQSLGWLVMKEGCRMRQLNRLFWSASTLVIAQLDAVERVCGGYVKLEEQLAWLRLPRRHRRMVRLAPVVVGHAG